MIAFYLSHLVFPKHSGCFISFQWVPNVQMRNLFSDALNRPFRIQTTSSVLRDMEKIGGLDAYLLKQKPDQLDAKALWLRASVLRAKEIRGL